MPIYKYFDIAVNNGRLFLYCTDFNILDALAGELANVVTHSVSPNGAAERGNMYILHRLGAHEYEAFNYLVRRLCEMGWEPISAASRVLNADIMPDRFIAFRFLAGA